ncbi:MAG TPA: hypothetical protein VHG28_00610 [Longimicrobiaceae bacterium]|nr:hypothetical protein [Longimicrobiaceae bacterium]
MSTILSMKQSDLLRELSRRADPVPEDHLDGRVVRALEARNFIERREGGITLSGEGRAHFENHVRRRRRATHHGAESDPRGARAEAIRRAIEILELAVPREAEVLVGDVEARAHEVVEGLRRFGQSLESRGVPAGV